MTQLMDTYPQMLGIGIDEATALIVKKSKAEVVGRGRVFFYDRNEGAKEIQEEGKDYVALPAGSVFDLEKRSVVKDKREK